MLIAAARLGVEAPPARRRTLHAFDPRRKRMATIDEEADGSWVHVKGAPLELLERCDRVRHGRG